MVSEEIPEAPSSADGTEHGAFLARLDRILAERKLSRRGLALAMGVSQTGLNAHWSKGSAPSRTVLIKMARALEVELKWLIAGEGPIRAEDFPSSGGIPSPILDAEVLAVAMRRAEVFEAQAGGAFGPQSRAAAVAAFYAAEMKDRTEESRKGKAADAG